MNRTESGLKLLEKFSKFCKYQLCSMSVIILYFLWSFYKKEGKERRKWERDRETWQWNHDPLYTKLWWQKNQFFSPSTLISQPVSIMTEVNTHSLLLASVSLLSLPPSSLFLDFLLLLLLLSVFSSMGAMIEKDHQHDYRANSAKTKVVVREEEREGSVSRKREWVRFFWQIESAVNGWERKDLAM